jgi:hypothetical protein
MVALIWPVCTCIDCYSLLHEVNLHTFMVPKHAGHLSPYVVQSADLQRIVAIIEKSVALKQI